MSKVFEYMKPYAPMFVLSAFLLAVEAYCALILPGRMADIVNDGVIAGSVPFIWRTGVNMLFITIFSAMCALVVCYLSARISTGVANDLREAVFKKVLHFSNAEINKFSTSSLITRTTNDVTQVQNTLIMAIRMLIYAPILGIGGIIRASGRDMSLTWIIAIATLTMVGIIAALIVIVLPKFKMVQTLIDRLNMVSRENLSGILIVRAFNTQQFEKERFDVANKNLADTNQFVEQAFAFVTPSIMLVINVTTALIVWFGAHQASAFRIDIGDMFAFMQYGILILFSFIMIAVLFVFLPRAVVSAERIKEVLETEGSLLYKKNALPLPKDFKGEIEFKNVTFRFPDATEDDDPVLKNLNFVCRPGQTTAIIGATGSGKSTILQLLLRFYDVVEGGIYLDGLDIRDVSKQELHNKIGYVPQKAHLFSGTIRSNLLYADRKAGDDRIKDAVDISQSASFIEEKEEKYETNVAQGGTNFSGGQRQRLSIARALVKSASIHLFDDSFSALDLKTDALLRAALKRKAKKSTKMIVAQRISTIMDADQIIVLEHGKIVGLGTHFELMGNCEVYREIAASQLTAEEVNMA